MATKALARRSREAKAWLFDAMLPLWAREAVDKDGDVFAALDLNHRRPDDPEIALPQEVASLGRALSIGRELGWQDPVGDGILKEVHQRLCQRPTETRETLGDAGRNTRALAEIAACSAEESGEALAIAVQRFNEVDATLKTTDDFGARRIWAEAGLVLVAADASGGHMERVSAVISDAIKQAAADPVMLVGDGELPIPVGELFSWAALMGQHAVLIGGQWPGEAEQLYAMGLVAETSAGRYADELDRGGHTPIGGRGLFTQAEALRAHLARLRLVRDDATADRARAGFDTIMDEHLTPEGGWMASYDADGLPLNTDMWIGEAGGLLRAFADLIDTISAW